MNLFQASALTFCLGLAVVVIAGMRRGRLSRRVGAAWVVLWLVAAGAIAFPSSMTRAAQLLGIGRGADLVLYAGMLLGFAAFFVTYGRVRRLEESLSLLVRELALKAEAGADAVVD